MSYKNTALALSPVGLWMFDEASGTAINDSSGNTQTGTYQTTNVTLGGSSLIPCPGGNGRAVSLSGRTAGTYVGSIPNSATIALTSFTFVMWFKAAGGSTTNDVVVSMDGESTSAGQGGWEPFRDNNTGDGNTADYRLDTAAAAPAANLISGLELFDGKVHLLACGVTANTAFISVDAGAYQTTSITGTYAAPTVALVFGNTLGSANNGALPAPGTYQGAAMFSGQLTQAQVRALYQAGLGQDIGAPSQLPISAIRGNDPWWAAPLCIHQHNVVFHAANPIPYDQQMMPIPAVQAGMAPWQAPHIHQHNVVFHPANPIPHDQQLLPPPGWQLGMAGWWAPVVRVSATTTPFHGATENDARPSQLPLAAIVQNQPWVPPIVQMRHTIASFNAVNPPDFTAYKIPIAAIQGGWWAPIIGARSSSPAQGLAPVVGADPIVVWRHRAGMQ